MVALGEYTADMGATRLVPGSHRWPYDREPQPDEVAIAEMAPGAAVVVSMGAVYNGISVDMIAAGTI